MPIDRRLFFIVCRKAVDQKNTLLCFAGRQKCARATTIEARERSIFEKKKGIDVNLRNLCQKIGQRERLEAFTCHHNVV